MTFNTKEPILKHFFLYVHIRFKPYYKWMTFNTYDSKGNRTFREEEF